MDQNTNSGAVTEVSGGAVAQAAAGAAPVVPGADKPKRERIDYEVCDSLESLRASTKPTELQKPFKVLLPVSMFGPGAVVGTDASAVLTKFVYANNSDMAVTRVCRKLGASAEGIERKRTPKPVDSGKIEDAISKMTPEARAELLKKYLAGATPTVVSGTIGDVKAPVSQSTPEFDAATGAAATGSAPAGGAPAAPVARTESNAKPAEKPEAPAAEKKPENASAKGGVGLGGAGGGKKFPAKK